MRRVSVRYDGVKATPSVGPVSPTSSRSGAADAAPHQPRDWFTRMGIAVVAIQLEPAS